MNLLDITWTGLFTPDDMIRYIDDCRLCWRREGIRDGYRERIVFSDNQPLSQGTLAVHSGAFTDFPVPSRTAMVTKSAIARMQIRRTMPMRQLEIFDTPEAALDWLMEGDFPSRNSG
jgi:hypothetical protein